MRDYAARFLTLPLPPVGIKALSLATCPAESNGGAGHCYRYCHRHHYHRLNHRPLRCEHEGDHDNHHGRRRQHGCHGHELSRLIIVTIMNYRHHHDGHEHDSVQDRGIHSFLSGHRGLSRQGVVAIAVVVGILATLATPPPPPPAAAAVAAAAAAAAAATADGAGDGGKGNGNKEPNQK